MYPKHWNSEVVGKPVFRGRSKFVITGSINGKTAEQAQLCND